MSLAESLESVLFTCPQCAWAGDFDARFPAWCPRCDHGLNALTPSETDALKQEKGRARRTRESARKRADSLQASLAAVDDFRPGAGLRLAATAFGILTHLVALAVFGGSVLLLLDGNFVGRAVGLLGLGIAWAVRPRVGRGPKKQDWSSRADLPLFFAVLDKAAAPIGAPVPDLVRFSGEYNAANGRAGLRRTGVMHIGVPLWQALSGQERLALLGHELGHAVNGDAAHGLLADSAARSLSQWQFLFQPKSLPGRRHVRFVDRRGNTLGSGVEGASSGQIVAAVFVTLCLFPVYVVVTLLLRMLGWLEVHVSLRAEFAADDLAARVGSTSAALGLMRKLTVAPSVSAHIRRVKALRGPSTPGRPKATPQEGADLWAGLGKYLDTLPEHEYLRQARVSEVRGTVADASHPATHLRIQLLAARPPRAAAVTVSEEEWAAVDRELAGWTAAAGAELLR